MPQWIGYAFFKSLPPLALLSIGIKAKRFLKTASLFYFKINPNATPIKMLAPNQWLSRNALKQPSRLLSLIS